MTDPVLILVAFVSALALTWGVREFTLRKQILDVPGERSMHSRPTPRGGGLSVVLVFLATLSVFWFRGALPDSVALALIGGGAAVAIVGFLDDVFTLGNRVRMAVWVPTAAWAVYWLGGFPVLDLGVVQVPLGLAGSALAVVGVVWMINLYNFMDGIDGLAGGQAVMVGSGGAALLLLGGADALATVALVLAAATAGFLVWNFPPARIFMGDVCSGFLGYVFAVLALASDRAGAVPLTAWAVLMSVFLIDASFTVARRVKAGEPWHQAHRSHAYQRAVQAGHSHLQVTGAILLIDLALIGVAYMIWNWRSTTLPALAVVVVTLGVVWWRYAVVLPRMGRVSPPARPGQQHGGDS